MSRTPGEIEADAAGEKPIDLSPLPDTVFERIEETNAKPPAPTKRKLSGGTQGKPRKPRPKCQRFLDTGRPCGAPLIDGHCVRCEAAEALARMGLRYADGGPDGLQLSDEDQAAYDALRHNAK